jgi:phenylacetic acid degradation operon negative regulatory protein
VSEQPEPTADLQPLSARSVLVSALLGTDPPALPPERLARVGALFGLRAGTVRTALSRMVTNGDAVRDERGWYRLGEQLAERRERQVRGRSGPPASWSGQWVQAVVLPGARPAAERIDLRRTMERLRFGELRDGVWMRPDNLGRPAGDPAWERVARSCMWSRCSPDRDEGLAPLLWDLDAWADRAAVLRRSIGPLVDALERGDTAAHRPGFELSAAVLRHLVADPLLPIELLPRRWPGDPLRATYDRFDRSYRRLLLDYLSSPRVRGGRAVP